MNSENESTIKTMIDSGEELCNFDLVQFDEVKKSRMKSKPDRFAQFDILRDEFFSTATRNGLLPACCLFDFFKVHNDNIGAEHEVFCVDKHMYVNDSYLLTINYTYLIVTNEMYTINGVDYQSRFLVELGYAVNDTYRAPSVKKHKVLSSIRELEKFIAMFKANCGTPFFITQ